MDGYIKIVIKYKSNKEQLKYTAYKFRDKIPATVQGFLNAGSIKNHSSAIFNIMTTLHTIIKSEKEIKKLILDIDITECSYREVEFCLDIVYSVSVSNCWFCKDTRKIILRGYD